MEPSEVRFSELKQDGVHLQKLHSEHGLIAVDGYLLVFKALKGVPFKKGRPVRPSVAPLVKPMEGLALGKLLDKRDLGFARLRHLHEFGETTSRTGTSPEMRISGKLVYYLAAAKAIHEHGPNVVFPEGKAKLFDIPKEEPQPAKAPQPSSPVKPKPSGAKLPKKPQSLSPTGQFKLDMAEYARQPYLPPELAEYIDSAARKIARPGRTNPRRVF